MPLTVNIKYTHYTQINQLINIMSIKSMQPHLISKNIQQNILSFVQSAKNDKTSKIGVYKSQK